MSPFRLLILALLGYIFYRLFFKGRRKKVDQAVNPTTVLVEDPICHLYLPQTQALMLRDGGEPVYFCSEKCREAFRAQKRRG